MRFSFKTAGLILWLWTGLALCLPGENLYNGDTSAEAQPETLTAGTFTSSIVPWVWDDAQAFDGKRSIRIDWDAKSHFFTDPPPAPIWGWLRWMSVMNTPDLEVGKKYVFSFYAKASGDNYPIQARMLPSLGWGALLPDVPTPYITFHLSREWKRYCVPFVPQLKEDAVLKSYAALFDFRNSPPGTVWYDAVQIEQGDTPTPYKNPSPMNVGVLLNAGDWCHIYFPDEPVIATLRVDMPAGKARLDCKVVDYQGQTVKDFTQPVNGSCEIKLPLGERLGWFKITAKLIADNGKIASTHSVNYLKIKKPVETVPGIEPFLGVVSHGCYYYHYYEDAKKLGVKRTQCLVYWKASQTGGLELTPGKFNWREVGMELKKAKACGMLNKVAFSPYHIPDWYFDPKELAAAAKTNSHLVLDMSKHEAAWRKLISEFMRRYGDLIDVFEIAGEDNGRLGFNQYYKSLYPKEVKNNLLVGGKPFDDLCAMVKIGAAEIRKTHPKIKIGAIRPSRWGHVEELFFTRAMLKKIGKDFDVFPADYYFYPYYYGPAMAEKRDEKSDGLVESYNTTKKALAEFGTGQPIYISEFGWAIDVRFPDDSSYRREQAETMARDLIAARAAGYFAFDWYTGFRAPTIVGQYPFPMAQDFKIQSIAAAYSAAGQALENVTESKWLAPDRATRIAIMRKADGKGVAAAWSAQGYKLSFPLMKEVKVTDLMGNPIAPAQSWFELSPAPIYIWCDDFSRLSGALAKADIEMTEFCNIRFRMLTAASGQVQFVNNSNNLNFKIDATISAGGEIIKRTVEVPKGSSNTCDVPLSGRTVEVKAQTPGNKTVTGSFTLPSLIPIAAGSSPETLIAQAEARADVLPGDPWVPWTGPDDLSVKIFSSWDAEYLYLKALVKDDLHFNKFGESSWKADSFQVGIDPQNNGSLYVKKPTSMKHDPDDFEFCLGLGDDGKTHCNFSYGRNIGRPGSYTVSRDEKAKTTTYTLRLAWKDLGVKPQAGMVFGMSFVVFDDDTGSGQGYYIPIGGGIAGSKNPALYKKYILK